MKRQNKPLAQQKPWEEMTEEERQVVRESWKHTLPEKFDVFCIGDLVLTEKLVVPGNLYVSGSVSEIKFQDVSVNGDFIVDSTIDVCDVNVGGDFIIHSHVDSIGDTEVGGNFIADGDVDACDIIVHGNFIAYHNVNSYSINVGDLFSCYDVETNFSEIYAADFVCRCYEEKK